MTAPLAMARTQVLARPESRPESRSHRPRPRGSPRGASALSGLRLEAAAWRSGSRETAIEVYAGGAVVDQLGGNNIWSALRYSAARGGFEEVHVSEHLPGVQAVALARAGARTDIVVALSNGTVRRYDQQTRRLRKATKGQCARRGGLYALATGDLNGDGFDETIAYCGDQSLFVYGTNYPRWRGDVFASGTFGVTWASWTTTLPWRS